MESTHVLYNKYEPRLFEEVGLACDISNLIKPIVEEMGFRIVQVSLLEGKNIVLQILLERDDGSITLRDCEELSKAIFPIIDIENIIDGHYKVEISSPGIDRPMVRKSDFIRWNGYVMECEVRSSSGDKQKFVGKIIGNNEVEFFLEKEKIKGEDADELHIAISFASLISARLVITDELIRASLNG
ncbi:ribosome maturation factor RimP [Candidatus Liberibacter brunswickensis]|uniref:ribosome maturation factor RimP n=1 Tax=Candidatus Liberibacter brunswickensis TaxID=1968796 RepID=UPI002FE0B4B4